MLKVGVAFDKATVINNPVDTEAIKSHTVNQKCVFANDVFNILAVGKLI